jgi:hypothetical protein
VTWNDKLQAVLTDLTDLLQVTPRRTDPHAVLTDTIRRLSKFRSMGVATSPDGIVYYFMRGDQ